MVCHQPVRLPDQHPGCRPSDQPTGFSPRLRAAGVQPAQPGTTSAAGRAAFGVCGPVRFPSEPEPVLLASETASAVHVEATDQFGATKPQPLPMPATRAWTDWDFIDIYNESITASR